jgi:hypothetical protein
MDMSDKVLRRILGSKRGVIKGRERCHQEKVDNLHVSPIVIELIE